MSVLFPNTSIVDRIKCFISSTEQIKDYVLNYPQVNITATWHSITYMFFPVLYNTNIGQYQYVDKVSTEAIFVAMVLDFYLKIEI